MKTKLIELYRSINKNVQAVYVFPDIKRFSIYNPYLKIFYKDLLSQSDKPDQIHCTSPHPLLPFFIVKRLFGEKSIVHFHWLQFLNFRGFLILLWKMSLILLYKSLGGHIVWTIHNKHLHSKRFLHLNIFFRKLMAKIATKLHVHCNEAVHIMAPLLEVNKEKFFIIEHPMYQVTLIEQKQAREYLVKKISSNIDISKPLFLMYGNIGGYKGIVEVIQLFTENTGQLIIAGECKKGERNYLRCIETEVTNKKNIHLISKFLSQEEEMYLFNASDCIIFNFKDILSSGSVMLALSYKKEIVIPNISCLKELSGPGVYKFNSQTELHDQIHTIAAKITH